MPDPDVFTGAETPSDVLQVVLDEFTKEALATKAEAAARNLRFEVFSKDGIPFLKVEAIVPSLGFVTFTVQVDQCLLPMCRESERIHEEMI